MVVLTKGGRVQLKAMDYLMQYLNARVKQSCLRNELNERKNTCTRTKQSCLRNDTMRERTHAEELYQCCACAGNYDEYFGMATDVEAVVYLMLMNTMIHDYFPTAITIGEDVSGMPTFCR